MANRTRNPDAKRMAVLSAASSLFSAAGFENTSTSSIASLAEVSEGIIYHYFDTKHGLLEACVVEQSAAVVKRAITGAVLDYDAMVSEVFTSIAADPLTGRLVADGDERVMGALRRGWQRSVVPALATALSHEQALGRCRAGDSTVLAHFQFAVVGEAMTLHFTPDSVWPVDLALVVAETAQVLRAISA